MRASWIWLGVAAAALAAGSAHAQVGNLTGALDRATQEAKPDGKPAAGEAKPAEEAVAAADPAQEGTEAIQSSFCAFTFFTNGADSLDLRGSSGEPCFDTGRGRDVFRLNPEDFLEGVSVFSGRGRSVFRLSDGPAMVFDQESTAEEIRTGWSDDTIRLGVGFAEDGRPVLTPETRVFPGGGNNLVVVGSGLGPALAPRHSANARIFPEGGTVALEAGCGRDADPDTVDVMVENGGPDSRVSIAARGCGVALRNHAAPTVWEQSGGRAIALLRPFAQEGEAGAFFEADIQRSSGLNFAAVEPRDDAWLNWSGMGDATIQIEAGLAGTGGTYTVRGDGAVFARLVVGEGSPVLDARTLGSIEVVVEGEGTEGASVVALSPWTRITWRPVGASRPPQVVLGDSVDIEARPNPDEVGDVPAPAPAPVPAPEAAAPGAEMPDADAPKPEAAKPAKDGKAPAPEAPVEEVQARDASGATQAGRDAMREGRPVDQMPLGNAAVVHRWDWAPVVHTATAGEFELAVEAPAGWCSAVGVSEGAMEPCDASARFTLAPGEVLRFETEAGLVEWGVEGGQAVSALWNPTR